MKLSKLLAKLDTDIANKIKKIVATDLYPDWFAEMSKEAQQQYLKEHPDTKVGRPIKKEKPSSSGEGTEM